MQRGTTIGSVVGGLVGAGDFMVTYSGSSIATTVAAGEAIVPGSSSSSQSGYYIRGTSATLPGTFAADPSNPRIDLVYLQVNDAAYVGATNSGTCSIAKGLATGGANLTNLSGAPSLPTSSLALAYVLIPTSASTISNSDIGNVAAPLVFGLTSYNLRETAGTVTGSNLDLLILPAATNTTYTLPAPTKNAKVKLENPQAGTTLTVNHNGSESIYGLGMPGVSTFQLSAEGATITLESDSANWFTTGGAQDSGWLAFSYSNSWASNGGPVGPGAAGYRLQGNVVRLGGTIKSGSSGTAVATLPAGYRPTYGLTLYTETTSGTASQVAWTVSTGGVVTPNFSSGTIPVLDGLTFTVD